MGEVDKTAIVEHLLANGTPRSLAVPYADALAEYREATQNIDQHGVIVLHPRTSTPIENPYLVICDRALKKLQGMINRNLKGIDGLW